MKLYPTFDWPLRDELLLLGEEERNDERHVLPNFSCWDVYDLYIKIGLGYGIEFSIPVKNPFDIPMNIQIGADTTTTTSATTTTATTTTTVTTATASTFTEEIEASHRSKATSDDKVATKDSDVHDDSDGESSEDDDNDDVVVGNDNAYIELYLPKLRIWLLPTTATTATTTTSNTNSTNKLYLAILGNERPILVPNLHINVDRGKKDFFEMILSKSGPLDDIITRMLHGFGPKEIFERIKQQEKEEKKRRKRTNNKTSKRRQDRTDDDDIDDISVSDGELTINKKPKQKRGGVLGWIKTKIRKRKDKQQQDDDRSWVGIAIGKHISKIIENRVGIGKNRPLEINLNDIFQSKIERALGKPKAKENELEGNEEDNNEQQQDQQQRRRSIDEIQQDIDKLQIELKQARRKKSARPKKQNDHQGDDGKYSSKVGNGTTTSSTPLMKEMEDDGVVVKVQENSDDSNIDGDSTTSTSGLLSIPAIFNFCVNRDF